MITTRWLGIALAGSLAACGGGSSSHADAAPPPPSPDAPISGAASDAAAISAACRKVAAPAGTITAVPGMFQGDLSSAGADIDIAGSGCTEVNTILGDTSFPGPDQVVEIDNLTPGTEYAVRVDAAFDAGFYVLTGCQGHGPTRAECLNAVDDSGPPTEAGLIAPPGGTVYVVVDSWQDTLKGDESYTLKVYEKSCATSFDCTDAASPVCDAYACAPGPGQCTGDDSAENGDDGPAGATDITPTAGTTTTTNANICSQPPAGSPGGEADWYKFTVSDAPASATVSVGFGATTSGGDPLELDVSVFDSQGRTLGFSYYNRPQSIALTYLPADTYYVKVVQVVAPGKASTTVNPYTVDLEVQPGQPGCAGVADCAAEFENQLFRGDCASDGACRFIDGQGKVSLGGVCDSTDDCDPTMAQFCTGSLPFVADADTGGFCSVSCTSDADCQTLGAGTRCSIGFDTNHCLRSCTSDSDCPVEFQTPGNWTHATCDMGGHCVATQ